MRRNSRTPRWGIVGAGGMAAVIGRALRDLGVEITAIASKTEARAEDLAKELSIERVYPRVDALLGSDACDLVYIASTNDTHFDFAARALAQGVAVLCEKPLALTEAEVAALIAASQRHRVLLVEALWTAFLPAFVDLRAALEGGELGQVRFVRADFGFAADFDPESRLFNPALGGGCLSDLGPYPMLLATMALGEPVGAHVLARLGPTGVDHHVAAMLDFGDGAAAQFVCSFELGTLHSAEVVGNGGVVSLDAPFWRSEAMALLRADGPGAPRESPYLGASPRQYQRAAATYAPQLIETMRCWREGLIESPLLPHAASARIARGLALVREGLPLAPTEPMPD